MKVAPGRANMAGYSLVECVAALALLMAVAATAYPAASSLSKSAEGRQAAGFMASRFRLARQSAALRGSARALVFDFAAGRWLFRVCEDGNGNGVRRAELGAVDACEGESVDVAAQFPGIRIERDTSVPEPAGGSVSPDPVRFGVSDLATFTPAGTATAGSLYLLSAEGTQYAVRVGGLNGRTRVLRYDRIARLWKEV